MRESRSPRGAWPALPLLVIAGVALGALEAIYQAQRPTPAPGYPGASGPDVLAYVALLASAVGWPGLVAVVVTARLRRGVAILLGWLAALGPTLFVVCDHQGRWTLWPWLIQRDPPQHYLRTALLTVALGLLAAAALTWITRRLLRARVVSRGAIVAAVVALPLACAVLWWRCPAPGLETAVGTPGATEAVRAGAPNVLLLTIDTLRQDALGAYGGAETPQLDTPRQDAGGAYRDPGTPRLDTPRQDAGGAYRGPGTPNLDALIASGARADGWSSAPWTRPAFATLFSGVGSVAQGSDRQRAVAGDVEWWPEQLRAAGYHTQAVVCNPHLERRYGFRRGFAGFEHTGEIERLEPVAQSVWVRWLTRLLDEPSRRADRMVDRARRWLDEAPETPWFLWVHLMDPHLPYHLRGPAGEEHDPAPGDWIDPLRPDMQGSLFRRIFEARQGQSVVTPAAREALRRLYQREVRFTDVHVGRLLEAARGARSGRDLLWIVTSDHGEEFWEHGGFEHGHQLHPEVLRVPLALGGLPEIEPGSFVGGMKIHDVGPTVLGLLDLPAMPLEGVARLGTLDPELRRKLVGMDRSAAFVARADAPDDEGCEPPDLLADGLFYGDDAVRLQSADGRVWLRRNGVIDSYDLCLDAFEQMPLDTTASPEHALSLLDRLSSWRADLGQRGTAAPVDPALAEQLRALGYID